MYLPYLKADDEFGLINGEKRFGNEMFDVKSRASAMMDDVKGVALFSLHRTAVFL